MRNEADFKAVEKGRASSVVSIVAGRIIFCTTFSEEVKHIFEDQEFQDNGNKDSLVKAEPPKRSNVHEDG